MSDNGKVRIFGTSGGPIQESDIPGNQPELTDEQKAYLSEPATRGDVMVFTQNAFTTHHVPLAGRFARIERITLDLCNFLQNVGLSVVASDGAVLGHAMLDAKELSEWVANEAARRVVEAEAIKKARATGGTEN